MPRRLFDKFLADFVRVYRTLPLSLRLRTRRVFTSVVALALLEVGAILSVSCLAVSIAAPEKLREFNVLARLFQLFPWLDALCEDPRLFALLVSSSVVCLIAAKNAMSAFVNLKTFRLGEHIALFAGETIFRHYLYSPYIAHLAGDSQAMFQALSWRADLGRMVTSYMTVYTYAAIALGMAVVLLAVTPGAVLLVIFAVAAAATGLYKTLRGRVSRAGVNAAEYDRKGNQAAMNAMRGIRETLIYRQQEVFFGKFRAACLNGMNDKAFLGMAPPIPTWTLETVGFLVIPIILWGMYALQDASMARITGVLTMIMLVSWRVLPLLNRSLSALVSVHGTRHAALDCLTRVETALAEPVQEPPEPDPDFTLSRDIAFAGICFRYPKAETDCLRDLTFTIPCGSRLGIIGQSGAGKSSMAAILSGLVEPTSGTVLVDGAPLSPAGLAAYCLRVGYVPQTPYILAGTLAENVAFSQWGKPWDEERVKMVCRMAELDVAEQRGTDAPVGADGAGLSGGQAQRLSIARALYAGPSVLILDEATSALDTGVEAAIMNTIFALPQSITTIIIAHRLSTVGRCDTLLWIDGGSLVASGPPDVVLPKYRVFLDGRAGNGGAVKEVSG